MRKKIVLGSAVALFAMALTATPAAAGGRSNHADDIAETVGNAAPYGAGVSQPASQLGHEVKFSEAGAALTVSTDPSDPVLIAGPSGYGVTVDLPIENLVAEGSVASDGTVVFEGRKGGSHTVVQALRDGTARFQVVLDSASSPSTYTFGIGGGSLPVLRDDGGADLLVSLDGGSTLQVGTIAPPWAVDAAGNTVETYYTVAGPKLVQHVVLTDGVVFPVTADPTFSVGWYFYLHFSKAETVTIANGGWGAATNSTICGIAGAAGGPIVAAAMAAVCLAYAGSIVYVAGVAMNSTPPRCLLIKFRVPNAGFYQITTYLDSRCRY